MSEQEFEQAKGGAGLLAQMRESFHRRPVTEGAAPLQLSRAARLLRQWQERGAAQECLDVPRD